MYYRTKNRMKYNEIQELFKEIAKLTGYDTKGTRNTPEERKEEGNDYYKKSWLTLDYASCYGGYEIRIVLPSTGQTAFDSHHRRPKKEMISYMRGLLKGLQFNK